MTIPSGVWLAAIATWLVVSSTAMPARSDAIVSGARRVYVVRAGESLSSLGARFGIEPRVLARDNFLKSTARLRTGQWIVVDDRHLVPEPAAGDELLINLPQRMLFRFDEDGAFAAAYPAGVGSPGWPTFLGPFTIATLEADPVWDVPASIQAEQRMAGNPVLTRVPPGPANPLGKYWIGLDRTGFGIHGTNAPASVFSYRTHGCVRLHPDDIAALFRAVCVGTRGHVIYEPVLLAETASGPVWLEAHPDPYLRQPDAPALVRAWAVGRGFAHRIDWDAVAVVLRERDGRPVNVSWQRGE